MSPAMPPPVRSPGLPTTVALTRRELVRIVRQPSRLLASVATPLLVWVLLGSGFARSFQSPTAGSMGEGLAYGAYLLPGMLTMTVLFSSIFGAMSLIEDRHEGFLQSVLVSPAPRWAVAASKLLGSSIISTGQALCLLPAAWLLGSPIGVAGAGMAAVALMCIAVGIAGLGLACAWWVDSTQGFHGVMNLLLLPMWLLSGSVFPLAGASGWLKVIMYANPVTWCTTALHDALGRQTGDPAIAWTVTVGFALFGVSLGWATLGRGVRRF